MFEQARITRHNLDDKYPSGWLPVTVEAVFDSPQAAGSGADKIRAVIQQIASYADQTRWPEDGEWKKILPEWLLKKFHYFTREELEQFLKSGRNRNELGWHFGSWLEAAKERVWRWWNLEMKENHLIFTLLVDGWPYSLGAFMFLVESAGAREVKEQRKS